MEFLDQMRDHRALAAWCVHTRHARVYGIVRRAERSAEVPVSAMCDSGSSILDHRSQAGRGILGVSAPDFLYRMRQEGCIARAPKSIILPRLCLSSVRAPAWRW